MESRELRIGNITEYGTILALPFEDGRVKALLEIGFCEIEQLEPILLSEEILISMGFEESRGYFEEDDEDEDKLDYDGDDPNRYFYKDNPESESWLLIQSSFVWKNPIVVYATNHDGEPISKEYKYVHEVQNLWFALTGTELISNTK
jgi:hypothetical protein